MAQITQFQLSLAGATWIDLNSQFGQNTLPDRLPDGQALQNDLNNLLSCWIGGRSRTFQPEYGSMWYQFLQEPIDQSTANKMQMAMIQALARWEPRITVDFGNSYITPDLTLPGYQVRIAFTININLNSGPSTLSFNIQV
jgi:phage baseplate assembly protein W